ncbi:MULTISPECIES: hypothetical protein [unclassified Pantoea]|uniref:hypothetical protein n=1 Tax=unclassified Pantoea TaxID=2630326 RepID=UPI001CD45587|nr:MULTISPECIES: hypothetical protein [unclassified Pantoea]MCA1178865.1 hypothetical protein [Pantoea sp. alder69]MCA1253822.1 hypothetical protein [Pantoea sp. alder70]MCA1267354.1 hypothetical protein [Pantoea sp. alder81]
MSADFSSTAFRQFIEKLPELNLIGEATARNLRNSSLLLLSVVEENEYTDIRNLNVDGLIKKYISTAESEPSEASIQAYKSRFNSAVSKFIDFQLGVNLPPDDEEDLIGEDAQVEVKKKPLPRIRRSVVEARMQQESNSQQLTQNVMSSHTFSAPLLLRPKTGLTIEIKGLPLDLTNEEAERIASFLKIYARP